MRLLIYDATDRKPHALLQELGSSRDVAFTFTNDADVLAAALAQRNHDLCLVLLRSEPSADLVEQLSKARSLPPAGVVSVHANPAPEGVRAMLALGARAVFVEPISPHRLLQAIRVRVHGPGPTVPLGHFAERNHAACDLRVPSRLARIAVDRPGELFVETDVTLAEGAEITLVDELPERFGVHRLTFRVLRREQRDLYYGLHHGYWIGDPEDGRVRAQWATFCQRAATEAAHPRPKVLWVSERRLAKIERWLPPAVWSIHPTRAAQVHASLLARIDPDVVVLDDPSTSAHQAAATWAESTGRRILRTGRAQVDGSPLLPLDEGFWEVWGTHVTNLPDRAQGLLHPARSSPLSRCTLRLPAELCATSPSGFEVACSVRLPEDAMLEVTDCDLARYRPTGLFGRVVRVEGDRARCELLPIGDDPQHSLLRGTRESISAQPRHVTQSVTAPHRAKRKRIEPATVVAVLALLVAAGALSWVAMNQQHRVAQNDPASTRAVMQAIGDAF
ncbi:MAG: hypothetical protein KC621_20425 [Myxococcales bacterium]|nr:hypothetical protein [Myxococcales bacterium]